jgi:hypothetical protein
LSVLASTFNQGRALWNGPLDPASNNGGRVFMFFSMKDLTMMDFKEVTAAILFKV